jgi:ADP-heptose:LPS heptosyltransferase
MTPMLRALRDAMWGRRIIWLIGGWSMELAKRYEGCADEIRVFSPQKATLMRGDGKWAQSVTEQWRILRAIKRQGVGVLISTMPEDPIARFVANTLNPRLWVGVGDHRPPRVRKSIETAMLPYEKDTPEAAFQMKLLELAIGPSENNNRIAAGMKSRVLEFPVTEDERNWAVRFLSDEKADTGPLVLLAPGSGWSGKNWGVPQWADLAVRLRNRGVEVAWTGSANERTLCAGPGHKWAGRLTLEQLAALMERAAVWVGNDSGPMHLAVAVGCRTVSLWGPTNEKKWGGLGDKHTKIRGVEPCPGCVYWDFRRNCPKPGHPCMAAIEVDRVEPLVWEAIEVGQGLTGRHTGQRAGEDVPTGTE